MSSYGPERFFYDKSSYTGVHKKGGPTTSDSSSVDLAKHLDRSPADARGVKLGAERTGSFKQSSSFSSSKKWNANPSTDSFPGQTASNEAPDRRLNRTASGRNVNTSSFSSSRAEILRTTSSGRNQRMPAGAGFGPERFFYDTSSYTGVHKNGGPSTLDSNTVDLSQHLDRSPADARGVKLNRAASSTGRELLRASSSSSSGKWNMSLRSSTESFPVRVLPGRSPAATNVKSDAPSNGMRRQTSNRRLGRTASGQNVYGPERFFYDKNSYTGAHKNGGPSTLDFNAVDLSRHLDRSPADVRGVKVLK